MTVRAGICLVGALLGAGFASGQEMWQFFAAFGTLGYVGLALAMFLFLLGSAMAVYWADHRDCHCYQELLDDMFPPLLSRFFQLLMTAALWLGLVIMLSGCAEFCSSQWPLDYEFCYIAAMILTALPLFGPADTFIKMNALLIPVLVVITVVVTITALTAPVTCLQQQGGSIFLPNWWVSALLYVLYNLLLSMAVLLSLPAERHKMTGMALGGLVLGGLAALIMCCLHRWQPVLGIGQLPMLSIAQAVDDRLAAAYGVALLLALYTTALANSYGLAVNFGLLRKHRQQYLIALFLPCLLFLSLPFSWLIGTVYPLLGYLSAPIFIVLVLKTAPVVIGKRH